MMCYLASLSTVSRETMHAESPAALEPEILVTFVHGTWGRGVFPALRISKKPYWFEPGGSFREGLLSTVQARGINCTFDIFSWSGSNSIRHRDEAAKRLANQIASNAKRNPRVRQVIIAHSHGGNVTARALGCLDSNLSAFRVCYLATPFMQLFPRTVERSERLIIAATMLFLLLFIASVPLVMLSIIIFDYTFGFQTQIDDEHFIFTSILAVWCAQGVYYWIASERSRRRNDNLIKATTTLRPDQSHGDALILRAVDDEASLALALGTIANLLSARLMSIALLLLLLMMAAAKILLTISPASWSAIKYSLYAPATGYAIFVLLGTSLLALVSRGVFGRELIWQAPGTQMNVQSVPDFIRSAEIRTLLREDKSVFFALRHGIHSHPNAGVVVADWICEMNQWSARVTNAERQLTMPGE